ncbi:MAG: LysR family transcriptional regulator [Pseudomonadota bacterium]
MSKSLDRLTLLETFVRIAERGTISAAARDLGIAQGSASRQLSLLEERLGTQLIRRTTHSLALTDAGLDALKGARELIAGWQGLQEQHSENTDVIRGPLKVIAPVALGQLHIADIVVDFQTTHHEVVVNLGLQDEIIRFAEVGCDCWIKVGAVPDETLIVRKLGHVERLLVGTPQIAAMLQRPDPDAAADLPIVALTPFEGGKIRLTSNDGQNKEIQPPVRLATNNIMALKRAAIRGIGAAVLPRWFVANELRDGKMVDLLPDWRAARLEVNAAYLPVRRQPRRLSAFLSELAARVRQVPGISSVNDTPD